MYTNSGNIHNRQKIHSTPPSAFGMSGLSMQAVQGMAGTSESSRYYGTSEKGNNEKFVFETEKSYFPLLRLKRNHKKIIIIVAILVLIFFFIGIFVLFSRSNSLTSSEINKTEPIKLNEKSDKSGIHIFDEDHIGDWSEFEEDWLGEHDFVEEEVDDLEDHEHGDTHYANVMHIDNNNPENTINKANNEIRSTDENIYLEETGNNNEITQVNKVASPINRMPKEVEGSIPPLPSVAPIEFGDIETVYFPKSIHVIGRVGDQYNINGKYTVMMHPYHEDSPWVHGGRLIWSKKGKSINENYYIFYEKTLHNWVLTNKFDLLNPDPIAFLPDHGVMPVKGVGRHGCKPQHYWYFRQKQEDGSYKLIMDRSVLVTDNGILLDSIPGIGNRFSNGSSTNSEEIIGLKLHKNQVHIDHLYEKKPRVYGESIPVDPYKRNYV
ncbi:hypothetical protein ACR3K2_20250 [Cryptosporidium serpentis]